MDDVRSDLSGVHEEVEDSKYTLYSIGVAAENKPLGTHTCEVFLHEVTAYHDGEITNRGERLDYDYTDGTGAKKAGSQTTSASVPAQWYCKEANRLSAPNVRRGEQLLIYKYADTGEFFWTPRNTNRNKRKLETVEWGFSGTTDEDDDTVTEDNHYILKVSTHEKVTLYSSSDKNGEVCRWFVQLRGSDGMCIVADDNNNEFLIDSTGKIIRLVNGDDTVLELNKKDGTLKIPQNYTLVVGNNAKINVTGNSDITVGGTATIGAGAYNLTAATMTFNGSAIFNGGVTINGPLAGQGGTFSSGVTFNGGHGPH